MIEQTMRDVAQSGGNTIYLSGPIRKATDNGKQWREELIEDYSDSYDFINPLDDYDPEHQEILNDAIDFDEEAEKEQILPQEYIFTDKMNILESDYVFVGLPEVISRGTCMECFFSHTEDIPFFVWTMNRQEESGWINYHAEFVGNERDVVMDEIKSYE